jgi:antitoxin VapB
MSETTVFQSGNSQAVRLPKEFRFKSKTVEIFRRGNEVVLREKPRTLGEVMDSLPPLTPEMVEELDQVFAAAREPLPQQERDWSVLLGSEPPQRPRKAGSAKAAAKTTTRKTARRK